MDEATVGVEKPFRILSAVPIIANVIVSDSIFPVLTSSTDYRLHLSIYDKYLIGMERGWLGYQICFCCLASFFCGFYVTRYTSQGRPADELKVLAPPEMNTVEQLLAIQNAISQAEELIQDGNIVLLKFRALLLTIFPQPADEDFREDHCT
ncbi:unnamed protein product [Cuscuta epithymum]|uniref:Uncharacterized protein n=1 Tax=Cuscuta epithymum TaxID=186058 RepID=A0AAV0D8X9_9ASTE|nr:unnamed protein product [Cuscuta epithymum]